MIGRVMRAAWPGSSCRLLLLGLVLGVCAAPMEATAQRGMPVYMDDSPGAEQALGRIVELANLGNVDEACRVLQELLVRDAHRVIPAPDREDTFIDVRSAAHDVLLSNPIVLERYRALEGVRAEAMLEAGLAPEVERTRMFTTAGLEAVLTRAQRRMESARFAGAWRMLMQAEQHPDRTGELGRVCARMAAQIESYLRGESPVGGPARQAIVERWSDEAGLEVERRDRVEVPDLAKVRRAYQELPQVDLAGVLARPMASTRLGEPVEEVRILVQERAQSGQVDGPSVMHATPTLRGDVVYLNDSQTISALDRFTLTPIWRVVVSSTVRPSVSFSGRLGLEDMCEAIPHEGKVVALTGLGLKGRPSRDRVLTCVDGETGRILWTKTTQRGDGARDPGEGEFRGPLMVSEGVVMLTISREVTHQRLRSSTLVGYDIHTGERLWSRPLGSVGQQTWAATPETADGGIVIGGVLYRADRIGVISAVEVQTGRVLWMLRLERQDNGMSDDPGAWVANIPVVHDGTIILMSPDRQRVLQIDLQTGELIRSVQSGRLENPDYLLAVGGMLIGVARDSIAGRPLDSWWEPDTPTYTLRRIQNGIRGRVLIAGDELIVPMSQGIGRINARYTGENGFEILSQRVLEIDSPGIPLVGDGQLLVIDDVFAHSYLSWDSAETLLRERMEENPTDPGPAITYAELSYRAQRPDRILWATDRALRAIERDPLGDVALAARSRLFGSLLDMVEPPPDAPLGASLTTEQRDGIISRLARLATNPEQQVAALLAAARFDEALGRPERAVERYQQILVSPALARSMARADATTLPAEVAASRRLERLVRLEGRLIYGAYDAEVERLIAESADSESGEEFESIARRYPVSVHAPRAWLESAIRSQRAGNDRAMLYALESGVRDAESLLGVDDPTRAELNGRLIMALLRLDRLDSAADRIIRARSLPLLTVDSHPLDLASLSDELSERLAHTRRRPNFGPELARTWMIEGAGIIEPLERHSVDTPTDRILMRRIDGSIEMWRTDQEDGIAPIWTSEIEGDVLRFDRSGVYLSAGADRTRARSVVRLDGETGEQLWRTRTLSDLFDRSGEERMEVQGARQRIDTPLRSGVAQDEVLAVFDRRTLVLVERSGRMAAFDLETGQLLWAHERAPDLVHEADAGAGILAVVGTRPADEESPPMPDGEPAPYENVLLVFDIRTGEPLARHREDPSQSLRWVRIDDSSLVVAGARDSVFAYDPAQRSIRWRAQRPTLRDTIGAWFVPAGVLVLELDMNLHIIQREDGSMLRESLEIPGRLQTNNVRMAVVTLDDEHFVVGTGQNVGIFDLAGAPIGIDASERMVDTGLTPIVGQDLIVTLDRASIASRDDVRSYPLQLYELPTCRAGAPRTGIELGAPPRSLAALDGRLLITAGGVTMIIEALSDSNDGP